LNPPAGATVNWYVVLPPAATLAEAGLDNTVKSSPVPESATECGLPCALSAMVRVPARLPEAVGAKVTLIVQLAPAATGELAEQVVPAEGTPKSPLLAPVMAMLEIARFALPVFESVNPCAVLVVPTA